MSDPTLNKFRPVQQSAPAKLHFAVTPSDTVDFSFGLARGLYVLTDGNLAVVDQNDTVLVYPVTVGQVLDIECKRVDATDTTATCHAWL